MKKVLLKNYPDSTILIPYLGMNKLSLQEPDNIVLEILSVLDEAWKNVPDDAKPSTKITIIGHSTGSILARKTYIIACGENSDAPFESCYSEKAQRAWAPHIEKLILLAGINRGWSLTSHLYTMKAILIKVGFVLGILMMVLLSVWIFVTKI